jgi:hypothetical protein
VFDIEGVRVYRVFGCLGVLCGEALGVLGVWVFGCIGCGFFWFFFSTTKLRRPWYEFFFRSSVRR